eukprot:CAMPEP_0172588774 /NCGR_PEP_ID=MMETSP1068-20121228/7637_1 /TAXON_ID=35684 /ORGANISM="Pseudopedinella elastica, Strain CCMP716" /LENGTH=42 /DNA_ID= /DNA_START= /DNA_END= /DNA_ORIENTATION=
MPGQRLDAEHGHYGQDMNRWDSKLCLSALLDVPWQAWYLFPG